MDRGPRLEMRLAKLLTILRLGKYQLVTQFFTSMDSKYCSGCLRNLPLSSAGDGLGGRVFATCISCRNKHSSRRAENTSLRGV
jgi:hypothetical protein